MRIRGFTLIEVLLSLGLFMYFFTAIIVVYFNFSDNLISISKNSQCSDFSNIIIQKVLTDADSFVISTTSDEVSIKYSFGINDILQTEKGKLYLFKESEKKVRERLDYLLDDCGKTNILFRKNSKIVNSEFINSEKCLGLVYTSNTASSSKTACAFR